MRRLLSRIGKPKSQHATVLSVASIVATVSLSPLTKERPILREIVGNVNDWHYYIKAAAVGAVLASPETFKSEHKLARAAISNEAKDFPGCVDDFMQFISKADADDVTLRYSIGLWVLWNLKKAKPTDQEIEQLVPAISGIVVEAVQQYRAAQ